ncbi:MAG TPA: thiamine pyrophosphate-binding protein [Thermodesulfobacteriota bacterium]|nr:thiamine pyrophosphate-binding protein [Thermodesulfobacteriota bacterium]
MSKQVKVGEYLINKLYERGVRHVFGVPGDYALGFFKELEKSRLELINTSDEQGAGFAADAYARVKGLGVVCITYGVGGLKVANTTAQAFAEKSPVVVISGAPGLKERTKNPLLHHKVREFDTQYKVFRELTMDSALIDDPETAAPEIDRVLDSAVKYKRPVYIEIPRDMVSLPVKPYKARRPEAAGSETETLEEAIGEVVAIINKSRKPVIIAGVEIHRFGLQDRLLELLGKTNIPLATTILGKSVISETHPLCMGVYEGAMGREAVRQYVESSDCMILLGTFMTDVNLGIYTANIDRAHSICATSEGIAIRHHAYEEVSIHDFMDGLLKGGIKRRKNARIPNPPLPKRPKPVKGKKISVSYLFKTLNSCLGEKTVVIADPGDAMLGALDMVIQMETEFLCPAYYCSLGFAVPASLGVQMARPDLRPLVLVGDGAFQMTGMELSTIARFGQNPIVVVFNNEGYGTERPMLDGTFNDIHPWRHSRIPGVLNKGVGFDVHTEDELQEALATAIKDTKNFYILDVHLDKADRSEAHKRLTTALSERVR